LGSKVIFEVGLTHIYTFFGCIEWYKNAKVPLWWCF